MASITTLIPDVLQLLKTKGWFTDALAAEFSHSLSLRLQERFSEKEHRGLRLSKLGPKCPRALWYSYHHPELAQPMEPWAENKFAFGDIIETWGITLAKAAGHTVEGEQDAVVVDGIKGHRDCVVDGCIVDLKSTSSRSYLKFKDATLAHKDSFGYLDQLDGYIVGCLDDPLVQMKDRGYLWAIDKTLGHMCLYEHRLRPGHIQDRIQAYKDIVNSKHPPKCECETVPEGKSGNIGLGVTASYSEYKFCCFPHLRTFLYAGGPVYLTTVKRRPEGRIMEIDKNGKVVYNG